MYTIFIFDNPVVRSFESDVLITSLGFGNFDLYNFLNFFIIEFAAEPDNCCEIIASTND